MTYQYKKDDTFYDVEALDNMFTVAWWYPAQNAIILSYIDDDTIIKSEDDKEFIQNYIYNMHPKLKHAGTNILFENIAHAGAINEFHPNPSLGLQSFSKRLGLANRTTYLNADINERHKSGGGVVYHPAYYPVKQTDPDYKEDVHGYRFGYNSTNYDLTMLALFLVGFQQKAFTQEYMNTPLETLWQHNASNNKLTAKNLRNLNDWLFAPEFKRNMSGFLAQMNNTNYEGRPDYQTNGWILRKSWLLTGRYIDVARLNEKMSKIGLKRLLGMLGLHIMESEKLAHDTHIENLEQLADLFAYNISDVVNLQTLFEHKVYQNSFNVRGELLKTYPATVYAQEAFDPKKHQTWHNRKCDTGNYKNIRRDRLTRESTSAKFVEYGIAPYNPIKDIPVVSFMYPSKQEAKKLGIEPTDILEDTKKFFEENVTNDPASQAHQDFMQIYNFYNEIRGKSFNISDTYIQDYTGDPRAEGNQIAEPGKYIKQLMQKYNTNLFYHCKDEYGNVTRSTCLANFSIGGIHGAEVNMTKYNHDLHIQQCEAKVQRYVESLYTDATAALNGDTYIVLPEELELTERLQNKLKDPEERTIKIREFVKSGSTKAKGSWKEVPELKLFEKNASGKWDIKKKYTYVSVGPSHHEDFASYYPLLLSRLSVFINPDYHGYDEDGNPKDPYMQMFHERMKKKKEAKDLSLPEDVREVANIEQESRKLLINAASGAGDATFDNNIRANNAIISMRIIGQLFAWRIGQAQTLAGATVPSTNTDGLYTMNISAEDNDRILEEIAKDMYIEIEPERLDRFVSKDSNNRLEVADGKIESAKGGTLNSWKGPQPTQSLDHPAVQDTVLAKYLASERFENPANVPFDREYAKELFQQIIKDNIADGTPEKALILFQWIVASSDGKHRYYYAKRTNKHTGKVEIQNLQHYNRIFLLKENADPNVLQELYMATKQKIEKKKFNNQKAAYQKGECTRNEIWNHDEDALHILKQNHFDLLTENNDPSSEFHMYRAATFKVRGMPEKQHIGFMNGSIVDLDKQTAINALQLLDIDAYISMLAKTFLSWSNIA